MSKRVRSSKNAPQSPFRLLKRRHGLAEIVERRAVMLVKRLRVVISHSERVFMRITENAPRHGHESAQQRLGFFETTTGAEVLRVANPNGFCIFLAREPQASSVDFLPHA